jgi:YidC/Oxa1 family membrane protein insertase
MQPAFQANGSTVLPFASGSLSYDISSSQEMRLDLSQLRWQAGDVIKSADGAQSVSFTAIISSENNKPVLELTRTYTLKPGSNEFECGIVAENLSDKLFNPRFEFVGPAGIGREDVRPDAGIMGAFIGADNAIETAKFGVEQIKKEPSKTLPVVYKKAGYNFIWAAMSNKYFAAIVRPVPEGTKSAPDFVGSVSANAASLTSAQFVQSEKPDNNDTVFTRIQLGSATLGAAGSDAARHEYKFQVYLGPKDKDLFEGNALYRQLGYYHTIEFNACCGLSLFDTLSFAILALMKWVHTLTALNYGWIIIILVLLVRLALHPITKSSQVSMMKAQKLGPKAEEIKKKYADNKQEMNRRLMELYKEQGFSPILGCLPMLFQMPIWIALYSAIYAGIELRGAKFLPVWITDLSAPDAIIHFKTVYIPLLSSMMGPISSINPLPLLLAVGMYMQQKLTPTSPQATMSEQMKQQQKIMLIMMPVMMLLILYNAPSGLNLYIMASTFGGVIEQYVIRKHIREKEEQESQTLVEATAKTGGKLKKKKTKPFFKNWR